MGLTDILCLALFIAFGLFIWGVCKYCYSAFASYELEEINKAENERIRLLYTRIDIQQQQINLRDQKITLLEERIKVLEHLNKKLEENAKQ